MKAWEVHAKEGLDALTLVERPEPELQGGYVLLKVKAVSVNYRDLLVVKGAYSSYQSPFIPFSDGVGEVVATGRGVTRVKVGDRVAGIFMQSWIEGPFSLEKSKSALGGSSVDGMLAEYVALPETGVVHIPDHLTDEEAATLPCAAVTAWNALTTDGKLKAGNTLLILGSGGVSLFALQFAKLMGVRVIALSGNDAKLERLMQMGAIEGMNYNAVPNWGEKISALTNGVGVDRVIEVGGANTLNQSVQAVRYGGHISLIGVLTGFKSEISTVSILHKGVCVQGIYVGSREMFEAMNQAIHYTQMRPVVDRIFSFQEPKAALEHMECKAHFGKIVIRVDS